MKSFIETNKLYFTNRKFLFSLSVGVVFFIVSLFVKFYAGTYATKEASNSVTDIVLSNTRVYDVDGIFVYGLFI